VVDVETTSRWHGPYEAVASRIETMCADPESWNVRVPACPGWVVADVVAHLAGLAEDWTERRLDRYASSGWTSDQIDRFRGQPLPDVLDAWRTARRLLGRVGEVPGMGDASMWAFGDAVVHEADLGGALAAGRPPIEAVRLGARSGVVRWRAHLPEQGVASLRLVVTDWREFWCGEARSDATTLRVGTWDLFRLLYGRRSRSQVAALAWVGDPAPVLDAGLPYPFRWADRDLAD
jgi:hypothetical protein